jgi:lysophospholipase L1-like esterase
MDAERQNVTAPGEAGPPTAVRPDAGRREPLAWVFHVMSLAGLVVIFGLGLELYVRTVADDGMQFDLEMWKYALTLKQISADPRIGHEHRPLSAARLMGVDVRINSRKLRDREIPYDRTAGALRIMMLGDSFTEGWGVAVDDTFSRRIERLFAGEGVAAEVINAGVGNYNTIQEARYFLTEGFRYAPDIVVVNFTYNDAEPVPRSHEPGFIARRCQACVFLAGRLDALSRLVGARPAWSDYYLGLFGDGAAPGWQAAKGALHELAAFCHARGIKLLVASFPELHDVQNYRLGRITALIRAAAEAEGAGFVDLLSAVAQEDPAGLWVTPGDVHPNARANQLFAEALFAALQGLAPRRPARGMD